MTIFFQDPLKNGWTVDESSREKFFDKKIEIWSLAFPRQAQQTVKNGFACHLICIILFFCYLFF